MKRGPRPELVGGDSPCEAHACLATVSFQHPTFNIQRPSLGMRLRRGICERKRQGDRL